MRSVVETVRTTVFVGRGARARYWVLRAVLEAMHKKGSATIDFGQRSLSLSAGLNHQVVGRALRELCAGEFACLGLVQAARGTRAHKLRMVVPESLRDVYASARFAKGLAHGMRPIFRVLGHDAALVYEAIEDDQADTIASLCMVAGVSRAEIYRVLYVLAHWELIELVGGGGWRARGEMLAIQAERAGVMATIQSAIARFRAERRLWWLWLVAREALCTAD